MFCGACLQPAGPAEPSPPGVEDVLAELNDILGQDAKPIYRAHENGLRAGVFDPAGVPRRVRSRPGSPSTRHGPAATAARLVAGGRDIEVTADLSRLPLLADLDPESCYLGWSIRLRSVQTPEQISEVFMFVQDSSRVAIEVLAGATPSADDCPSHLNSSVSPEAKLPALSLHVPLVKANDLIQLAIALVRAQGCIAQAASDFCVCANMHSPKRSEVI